MSATSTVKTSSIWQEINVLLRVKLKTHPVNHMCVCVCEIMIDIALHGQLVPLKRIPAQGKQQLLLFI